MKRRNFLQTLGIGTISIPLIGRIPAQAKEKLPEGLYLPSSKREYMPVTDIEKATQQSTVMDCSFFAKKGNKIIAHGNSVTLSTSMEIIETSSIGYMEYTQGRTSHFIVFNNPNFRNKIDIVECFEKGEKLNLIIKANKQRKIECEIQLTVLEIGVVNSLEAKVFGGLVFSERRKKI